MADLALLARSRGLKLVADLLAKATLPKEWAADPVLAAPLATDVMGSLKQMIRRGADPRLAKPVLDWLAPNHVDLGLFSYDVLADSLLGPDDGALTATLKKNAHEVRSVLADPGARYIRAVGETVQKLIVDLNGSAFANASDDDVLKSASQRNLGALEELRRRGKLDPYRDKLLPNWLGWARSLHFAHLPTMASFHLTYLYRVLGYQPALADLCELLLDVGGIEVMPSPEETQGEGSADEVELAAYVGIRSAIIVEHTDEYKAQLGDTKLDYSGDPEAISKQTPRALMAHAEAMLVEGDQSLPYEVLTHIVKAHPTWRYGLRSLAVQAAARFPKTDEPMRVVDQFVANFGNEFNLWYLVNLYAPADTTWIAEFHARLVRELTHLPHDAEAWCSMATLLAPDQPDAPLGEVNGRTDVQCRLD